MARTPEQLNRRTEIIPKGTMLNRGPHEDDDYLFAVRPIRVQVLRKTEGAKIVTFKDDGIQTTLYWHQPEIPRVSRDAPQGSY